MRTVEIRSWALDCVRVTGVLSGCVISGVMFRYMVAQLQRRSSHLFQSKLQPCDVETLRLIVLLPRSLQTACFATACAIKTALILLYYHLFGVVRWLRSLLRVVELGVLASFIAHTLVAIFEGKPIGFYWDKTIKGGIAIDQDAFYRLNGFANLSIEFLILILSMVMVWRLNLDLRSQLTVSGVTLLGTV